MSDQIQRPQPPDDAASIIAHAMDDQGVTVQQLADLFGTTDAAIEAILNREVPVPLMWVPTIADVIEYDSKALMTLALGEQWLATLTAIAGTLLWEEGAVQRELIAFFTQLGDGECPSMSEDPARAERLWRAFQDPDAEGGGDDDSGGAVH